MTDNTHDSSSPIMTVQTNNNQARERRVVVNLDEYRKTPDSHESGDPGGSAGRSRIRRAKGKLIREQIMSGDPSPLLYRDEMSRMNSGLPLKPLPNEALRDAHGISEGGLPSRNLDGPFNRLLSHEPETSRASHYFQEPGSLPLPHGATSLAFMSKKRPLTEEEKKAAELIKQTISDGTKTQDEIAADVGVTQGMIWQWMNGKSPVPANRAQKLATSIGLHPSQVSIAWRAVVRDAKKLAWPFPKIDPLRWVDLSPGQKIRIEGLVLGEIVDIENKRADSLNSGHRTRKA